MEQGSNIKDHDEGFLKDKDHDRWYSGPRVEQWPQWFSNKYHTKNLCFVTFCYGRTGQKMNKLFNVNSPDLVVFHYALMVLWKITFLSPHHLFSCEMTAWKWIQKREISERFCSISFWLDTLSRATYCILNPREMDGNMDGNKNNYSKKSCVGSIDQNNNKQ